MSDFSDLMFSGLADMPIKLPIAGDYSKVSDYKILKFCVKCECAGTIAFSWSWDGTSSGLVQKYSLVQGRWETIKLDVLMNYLSIEVCFHAPVSPNVIVTCRAEGNKKRASFGIPPPFSPARRDLPSAAELTVDHDTVPTTYEPMEVDPIPVKQSPKKFRPWSKHKKGASPITPLRDDRFPGLFSKGCIFYGGGPGYVKALPIGEEGEVLTVVNGVPAWTKL